ncbi:UNVERIFIED_CONTAM: putative mitochondrial protein [Sesamum calycinum]|uniref:Mitochondrial protein n=1 Tax=Sesamum calycinum TaxID=2727403 RepID=A0AAW2PA65_9LAMI
MKSHDVAFWKEAVNDEMDSIIGNNTWVLVNLPPGCKPLGYKWIFKKKMKVDGTIEKFNARLVIQGFRQRPDKEVYMKQPEGFIMPGNEHKQVDLRKEFLSSRFSMKDMGEADVILGCLMYVMTSTRPDIAYAVGKLRFPSIVEGYPDASWITNVEDHSSTSGWVLLRGGPISWASKKQSCITYSTMESEFVALAAAGKDAEWLRNLIHEIPL